MRRFNVVFLLIAVGLACGGCPNQEPQQHPLVGTAWPVTVVDTGHQVSSADLSGTWNFYSDGTMVIGSNRAGPIEGTYSLDGTSVEFNVRSDHSARIDDRSIELHVSGSGTLIYDGSTLQGDGRYSASYSDSGYPEDNYSVSGDCTISGEVPKESVPFGMIFWLLFLLLIAMGSAA